ncbi:hypothetical protein K439DRAFT_367972 [Ramaria rubella]|nr:hypothetical protein K439DRAFT_367972 [Ramaria rubella]
MLLTRRDVQESRRGWRCIRMVKCRRQLYNGFVRNVHTCDSDEFFFVLCSYSEGDRKGCSYGRCSGELWKRTEGKTRAFLVQSPLSYQSCPPLTPLRLQQVTFGMHIRR